MVGAQEEAEHRQSLGLQVPARSGGHARHRRQGLHRVLVSLRCIAQGQHGQRADQAAEDSRRAGGCSLGAHSSSAQAVASGVVSERILHQRVLIIHVLVPPLRRRSQGGGFGRLGRLGFAPASLVGQGGGGHHRGGVAQHLQGALKRDRVEDAEHRALGAAQERGVAGACAQGLSLAGARHQRAQAAAQRRRRDVAGREARPQGRGHGSVAGAGDGGHSRPVTTGQAAHGRCAGVGGAARRDQLQHIARRLDGRRACGVHHSASARGRQLAHENLKFWLFWLMSSPRTAPAASRVCTKHNIYIRATRISYNKPDARSAARRDGPLYCLAAFN